MARSDLLNTIAALAAIGGGMPELKRSASKLFCQSPRCSGRKIRITESVTGASYCHRCGWFERKVRQR